MVLPPELGFKVKLHLVSSCTQKSVKLMTPPYFDNLDLPTLNLFSTELVIVTSQFNGLL